MNEHGYVALHLRPLTLKDANDMVARLHRHHRPATGHRFSVGVFDEDGCVRGAAIVSRPVARLTHQYAVAEVVRCVTDGTPNACSMLYGAAARAAAALGFERVQTFILESEPGTSLKAAGWAMDRRSDGGTWNAYNRPRNDPNPTCPKTRWVKQLNPPWPGG